MGLGTQTTAEPEQSQSPEAPPTLPAQQPGPLWVARSSLRRAAAPAAAMPLTRDPLSKEGLKSDFLFRCQPSSDCSPPWICPPLLVPSGCLGLSGHIRPWLGLHFPVGGPQPRSGPRACHPVVSRSPGLSARATSLGWPPGPRPPGPRARLPAANGPRMVGYGVCVLYGLICDLGRASPALRGPVSCL